MSKAILINDRGNERDYKISNGNMVTLKISDDLFDIKFIVNGKELKDGFEFDQLENGGYYITHLYIPGYEHLGLGRAALEFFKEYTGEKLYAAPNDGFKRNDGSHLTGDAPGFVARMQEEGIIEKNEYDSIDDFC